MFRYVCLGTQDPARARVFYDRVLATLDIHRVDTGDEGFELGWSGWGTYNDEGREELALWLCPPFDGAPASPGNGVMVAFNAATRTQVDAFHAAAMAAGGTSEGEPGLRPQYNTDFYAAYVRDPDGNKLAAVHRDAPRTQP